MSTEVVLKFVARLELVASGDVADYTEAIKEGIAKNTATTLGVDASKVKVSVTPASVKILTNVIYDDERTAQSASTTLKDVLGTQEQCTAFLQSVPGLEEVQVEDAPLHSVGSVVVQQDGSIQNLKTLGQSLGQKNAEISDLHPGAIAGIIIGIVVCIILLFTVTGLTRKLWKLSKDKLFKMKQLDMQKEKTADIFADMDTDGDGTVSVEEFQNFMRTRLLRGLTNLKLMGSKSNLLDKGGKGAKAKAKSLGRNPLSVMSVETISSTEEAATEEAAVNLGESTWVEYAPAAVNLREVKPKDDIMAPRTGGKSKVTFFGTSDPRSSVGGASVSDCSASVSDAQASESNGVPGLKAALKEAENAKREAHAALLEAQKKLKEATKLEEEAAAKLLKSEGSPLKGKMALRKMKSNL